MAGTKTSVWLSEDLVTRWKASGMSLTEIVRRGLDAEDPQEPVTEAIVTAVTEAVGDLVAGTGDQVRRIVREELQRAAGLDG